METWRWITTWGAAPGFNMGLDEALLLERDAPPTLRFYSWGPPTLSLGYFQRYADVPAAAAHRSVVRRITGGGAIQHEGELTFSLVARADHRLYRGPIAESYERVHAVVIAALAAAGVDARLRADAGLSSDRADTGMCFHRSTQLDIAWNGAKGVGSAQRRKDGRVLHHGSIKLVPSRLEPGVAHVAAAGERLSPESFAPLLADAFGAVLGYRLEVGVPSPDERAAATRLGTRYLDPSFVRRR